MAMNVQSVEGKNVGDVFMFALSTCIWCRKTKALLNELGIAYRYVDVDLAEGDARQEVMDLLTRWNKARSFPTLVVNDERTIIGFDEAALKELVGNG